ncbi:MAG: bifunctional 2-keto-4-hydroxyglutarate aldolase/2-keto-3-deoxy-6-phosphogluconate aldolase, partial [Planctomycetota bacterium]
MSMSREDVVEAVCEAGVVAVVRLPNAAKLVPAVEALRAGGVHAIEVTLTVPGALDIIRQLVESA